MSLLRTKKRLCSASLVNVTGGQKNGISANGRHAQANAIHVVLGEAGEGAVH